MFWKKKKESNESKHVLLIEAYLSAVMPLIIKTGKLSNPASKIAAQQFIIGMVDRLNQAQSVSWDEYISICRSIFKNHNLIPPNGTEDFIEKMRKEVRANEKMAKIMRCGAQSIETYTVERDANSPMDFVTVVMSPEGNAV